MHGYGEKIWCKHIMVNGHGGRIWWWKDTLKRYGERIWLKGYGEGYRGRTYCLSPSIR